MKKGKPFRIVKTTEGVYYVDNDIIFAKAGDVFCANTLALASRSESDSTTFRFMRHPVDAVVAPGPRGALPTCTRADILTLNPGLWARGLGARDAGLGIATRTAPSGLRQIALETHAGSVRRQANQVRPEPKTRAISDLRHHLTSCPRERTM